MRGLSLVTTLKLAPPPPPSAKSEGSFQAVLANASTEEISAKGATSSATRTTAKEDTAILNDDMQHGTQPKPLANAPVQGEAGAHAADAVASDDNKKAPEKRSAKSEEDAPAQSSAATKSSPAVSAPIPQVAPVAITPNIPAQPLATQLPQDASATERQITPLKQSDAAAASVVAVNDAANEATVSNGMQIAGSAAQPGPAIAQAFLDMPLAIAIPGNAIPAKIVGAADGAAGSNQPVSRATVKQTFDTAGSMNLSLAGAADAETNKTAPAANGSHDTPSHDSQSSQNMQGDASQQAPALPRAADNSLSQMQVQAQAQTIVPSAPVHEVASTPHSPSALTDTPRPTDQRDLHASQSDNVEAAATPDIRSAKLIQALNGTEMRVGMQSSEFGDISIRTFMSPQAMRTQISLDHSELSQVISTHVSSMQAKLGDEFGLHASIEINNQGSSLSGNAEQSSQRQYGSSTGSMQANVAANPAAADTGISMETLAAAGNGHQLDIRV